jgi:hypothetical protein
MPIAREALRRWVSMSNPRCRRCRCLHHQTGQRVDQRGLARAIRPQQPEDLTLRDIETDALQRQLALAGLGA